MMTKINNEYEIYHLNLLDDYPPSKLVTGTRQLEILSDMNKKGWELVSVIGDENSTNLVFYFKRPLVDE